MVAWPLALGTWAATNIGYHLQTMAMVNNANAEVMKPPASVSIVVCCWHENLAVLRESLDSIKNQNVFLAYPASMEVIILGCDGVDINVLRQYASKVACQAGKLSARNLGVSMASGDIIVSLDCDAWIGPNWLNMVLQPFSDPNVVAVETTTINAQMPVISSLFRIVGDMLSMQRMLGRGSAFRKSVFTPFRTDFDQRDAEAMVQIEEFDFFRDLSQKGRIKFIPAPTIHLESYGEGRGIRS